VGDEETARHADLARRALERSGLRTTVLVDPDLVIRWVSPHVERLLGWRPEEMIGTSALDHLHPEEIAPVAEILAFERDIDASLRSALRRRNVREVRVATRSGEHVIQEASLSNFYRDPDIGMLLIELRAPSQYRDMDRAVELSRIGADLHEILAVVLREFTAADPAGVAGAIFGDGHELLAATPNAPAPIGSADPAEFLSTWSHPLSEAGSTDDVGLLRVWSHLPRPHPADRESGERVARHAAVVIGRDRAMQELQRAALHDPLTGVANRRALERDLRSRRGAGDVMVAYLDLDGFKSINDEHGHEAGDQVLVTIADRLRASLRIGDLVARVGGDEFVLVFSTPVPAGANLRDRLRLVVGAPMVIGHDVVSIAASIGFATGPADAEALLCQADLAMLAHKRGR
jgi:diguanylate cyclase (GGDEF)-like protein/PAS domain S-box-containing protein